jgi:hypothetical protein
MAGGERAREAVAERVKALAQMINAIELPAPAPAGEDGVEAGPPPPPSSS